MVKKIRYVVKAANSTALLSFRMQARNLVTSRIAPFWMSFLESESISRSTLIDYLARILILIDWCQLNQRSWDSADTLDIVLLEFLDYLFWKCLPGSDGSKLLAAVKFIFPCTGRLGPLSLPRSHRAVGTWLTKRPPDQRVPLPWVALAAVLGVLCYQSDIVVAS